MSDTRQHLPWIDVLRIIGCICVLITHVEYAGGSGGNELLALIDYYGIAGFMPFFFISGLFAFSSPRRLGPYFRKKVRRIVVPTAVWSVIYLILNLAFGTLEWRGFFHKLLLMPIQPQVPQFWYLYVVFGIYLLTPVLSHWLAQASRRQVEFYLAIWLGSLFCFSLSRCFPGTLVDLSYNKSLLFYFQGYLGAALLGHYLYRYVPVRSLPGWFWPLATLLLTVPLWYRFTGLPLGFFNDYLSLNMLALSVSLFVLVRWVQWPSSWCRALSWMGDSVYGVYLMHMIVIQFIVLPLVAPLRLNYWLGIPLALGSALVICLVMVWVLCRLKFAWIFGCSRNSSS